MITLMKLELQFVIQTAGSGAALLPAAQLSRADAPSAPPRATSGPAIGMTWRRGSGPGWAVEQSLGSGMGHPGWGTVRASVSQWHP